MRMSWTAVPVVCLLAAVSTGLARVAEPSFYAGDTTVRVGSTSVIPFKIGEPAEKDQAWNAGLSGVESGGDGTPVLEVIREPEVLAGHTVGFLRVRPVREGVAVLRVGEAALRVVIAPPIVSPGKAGPVIHTPVQGAVAWGEVTVGADWFDAPLHGPDAAADVELVLGDGTRVGLAEQSPPSEGPARTGAFLLDFTGREPGPLTLHVEITAPTGTVTRGPTRWIDVVDPSANGAAVVASEAETHHGRSATVKGP